MDIITGYKGRAHVTAEQDRAVNQGIFGEGSYVLNVGQKMRAEIASNTEIRIYDGVLSHQGCTASIKKNAYDSVTIANGSQGMQRKDLIVARYTRDAGTGVEDITWNVIQGTPAASNPVTPTKTTGDIQAGDTVADMEMYVVTLNGINITDVASQFSVHTFASDAESISYDGDVDAENVKDAIDTVYGTQFSKVVSVNITATSVAASSGTEKTYTLPTQEGYTPIGVIGWYLTGDKASQITMPNMYVTGNTLKVYFRNITSGTVSLTTASYFDVLYIKNAE